MGILHIFKTWNNEHYASTYQQHHRLLLLLSIVCSWALDKRHWRIQVDIPFLIQLKKQTKMHVGLISNIFECCIKDYFISLTLGSWRIVNDRKYSDTRGRVRGCIEVFNNPDPAKAIFCFSGLIALGVMQGLRMKGLIPDQDIDIVGFDNFQSQKSMILH